MRVWLTGCKGMLGRSMVKQFEAANIDHVGTDIEVDLTSESAIESFVRGQRFSHIVNAAAYTRVDDAESDVEGAHAVNARAVKFLSEHAARSKAIFVHFSTDYVFPGTSNTPYLESDETGPTSVYGKSKLEGERWVLSLIESAHLLGYVIRTSWLFGMSGNNFVQTILKAMLTRDEVRVVHDQRGRPTYTEDLAGAAIRLSGLGGQGHGTGGVYHFANVGVLSWYEFTLAIADAARNKGLALRDNRVVPIASSEFSRPAPRPAYSVLDTGKIERALGQVPRGYEQVLSDYLDVLIPVLR